MNTTEIETALVLPRGWIFMTVADLLARLKSLRFCSHLVEVVPDRYIWFKTSIRLRLTSTKICFSSDSRANHWMRKATVKIVVWCFCWSAGSLAVHLNLLWGCKSLGKALLRYLRKIFLFSLSRKVYFKGRFHLHYSNYYLSIRREAFRDVYRVKPIAHKDVCGSAMLFAQRADNFCYLTHAPVRTEEKS